MATYGTCSDCGQRVRNVRDNFTGATFAVDLDPVSHRGFVLMAPLDGERNERAELRDVEVFRPHEQTCQTPTADGSVDGELEPV